AEQTVIALVPGLGLQAEARVKNPTAGDTPSANHRESRTYARGGRATDYCANCPLALRRAIARAKHTPRLHPARDLKSVRGDGVLPGRPAYIARGPGWRAGFPLSRDSTARPRSQAGRSPPARPGVAPAHA